MSLYGNIFVAKYVTLSNGEQYRIFPRWNAQKTMVHILCEWCYQDFGKLNSTHSFRFSISMRQQDQEQIPQEFQHSIRYIHPTLESSFQQWKQEWYHHHPQQPDTINNTSLPLSLVNLQRLLKDAEQYLLHDPLRD